MAGLDYLCVIHHQDIKDILQYLAFEISFSWRHSIFVMIALSILSFTTTQSIVRFQPFDDLNLWYINHLISYTEY